MLPRYHIAKRSLLLPTESVPPSSPPLLPGCASILTRSPGVPEVSSVAVLLVPLSVVVLVRVLVLLVAVVLVTVLVLVGMLAVAALGVFLERRGGIKEGLVRAVLAQGRGRQAEEGEDLLSEASVMKTRAATHRKAPERTVSPSSSTQTLRMSSVWRTLRTQPTTLSASSNWSPIREKRRASYSAGVTGCSNRIVNFPPLFRVSTCLHNSAHLTISSQMPGRWMRLAKHRMSVTGASSAGEVR